MNENSGLSAVRDSLVTARNSLTEVRMDVPLDTIVRNGQAKRARRRLTGLTAAAAVAAGATLTTTALLPAGHKPGHPAAARLTAWTVTRRPSGNIDVTIRQLRDPAGLQRKLRADGVPASITFLGHPNRSCQHYPAGRGLARRVFPVPPLSAGPGLVVVIHPSALPSGAGVEIGAHFIPHPRRGVHHGVEGVGPSFTGANGLVRTSKHCTGG